MPLIPLIEKCNQRCLFCAAEDRHETISFERNKKAIDRELDKGSRIIILSGGETTLCPDVFHFIKYIRSRGAGVELQTNALTSSNPKMAKALVMSGVSLFNVNFPSNVPEINDELTGIPGSFARRLSGVKNLLSFGAAVRITHIVCEQNYRHLPDFVRFIHKELNGIKFIQFSFLKAMGGVLKRPCLLPSYEDVSSFIQEAFCLCEEYSIEAITDHIPPCFLARFYDRNVDYIKTGEGAETSLPESEKKQLPECAGCIFKSRCFGPREDYMLLKKKLALKPVLELPVK
ncbi:MAG: radical SAM protein [Elusimicrobiales bacterium]|nr:radical SAM protein [Elusimicrobiales bacterium]